MIEQTAVRDDPFLAPIAGIITFSKRRTTMTQRFDQEAATWDENPRRVRLAKTVAETIAKQVPLSRSLEVLDFGCGTGLLTMNLRSLVGTITGADTSPGMLGELRQKVQSQDNVELFLLTQEDGCGLKGTYDLIVSSMTLHHVRELAPLFRSFRDHLRTGGKVALADLDAEDGTFHEKADDVFHLGFERKEFKAVLAEAGFVDLNDVTAFEIRRNSRDYPIFLVTGRKAD
jgi:SAM-dependent methyltransferase